MHNSTEQIVDEILVLDAQSGRREAFEALVARWQKRLWWHAYNLTGGTEAAWDTMQESWLAMVRGLGRLKDPAKFGAWAYRIVSHKSHDWLARNRREAASEVDSAELTEVLGEPRLRERAGEVHEVLRRLATHSQVVLNLYYLEGFGIAEIAQILGTPEGTVKSRLHTARIEFRKHWQLPGESSPAPALASAKEKQHE